MYLFLGSTPTVTLAPEKVSNPLNESKTFMHEIEEELCAPDEADDHPNIIEMRRRILDLIKEAAELHFLK